MQSFIHILPFMLYICFISFHVIYYTHTQQQCSWCFKAVHKYFRSSENAPKCVPMVRIYTIHFKCIVHRTKRMALLNIVYTLCVAHSESRTSKCPKNLPERGKFSPNKWINLWNSFYAKLPPLFWGHNFRQFFRLEPSFWPTE